MLFAMVFPGLGQAVAGEVKRGVLIATGILGLFFGGMFIGGIDVVDSKEDAVWFYGQALVGPLAFGVDWAHQNRFKVIDAKGILRSANPDEGRDPATGKVVAGGKPPNRKSLGKVNELGTLFATVAGMINLVVILDAGFPSRDKPKVRPTQRPSGGSAGANAASGAAA